MPMIWTEPDVFMTYKGIVIYHTYKDDIYDYPSTFWYSTAPEDPEYYFDVRELPYMEGKYQEMESLNAHRNAIEHAIDNGLLKIPE